MCKQVRGNQQRLLWRAGKPKVFMSRRMVRERMRMPTNPIPSTSINEKMNRIFVHCWTEPVHQIFIAPAFFPENLRLSSEYVQDGLGTVGVTSTHFFKRHPRAPIGLPPRVPYEECAICSSSFGCVFGDISRDAKQICGQLVDHRICQGTTSQHETP